MPPKYRPKSSRKLSFPGGLTKIQILSIRFSSVGNLQLSVSKLQIAKSQLSPPNFNLSENVFLVEKLSFKIQFWKA